MKRHTWPHLLAAGSLSVAVLAACSGPADAPNGDERENVGSTSSAITADSAIARAREWVAVKLPYCQSANHQPDGDKACSPVCTRPDNPDWDPYRSDCSGLVSWAWGLPAPGRVTWELAPAQTDITSTIPAASLQPGDAINKPHDHTMLFVGWVVPGQRATFIEEPGCSSSTPYAHELDSDVTISGTSITVAHNGITFDAIRYQKLQPSPDAGAPDAGHGSADAGAPDTGSTPPGPSAPDSGATPSPPSEDAGSAGSAIPPEGTGFGESAKRGCALSHVGATPSSNALLAISLFALLGMRWRRSRGH
jgi:hypothetical protein